MALTDTVLAPTGGRGFRQSTPPTLFPYVLLRQVDDGPRDSGGPGGARLPHSVLAWVTLQEKATSSVPAACGSRAVHGVRGSTRSPTPA